MLACSLYALKRNKKSQRQKKKKKTKENAEDIKGSTIEN
jgi:hypothetical protein